MTDTIRIKRQRVLAGMFMGVALAAFAAVPSGAAASVSVAVDQGKLTAVGDGYWNGVSVSDQNNPACPGGTPCYEVKVSGGPVTVVPPCVATAAGETGGTVLCPDAGVTEMTILGRDGVDTLAVSESAFGLGVPATLKGGVDADNLHGSDEDDTLIGGTEEDYVWAGEGDDVLRGNAGYDRLIGEKGNDRLVGGPGFDNLIGGLEPDELFGSGGNDGLDGGGGKDRCDGGKDRDTPRNCERRTAIP